MNYLLYQPASLTEPDKVYLNGFLIEDATKRGEIYDKIVAIFNRLGNNTYPWIGKSESFYVLRGLFEARDEKGRTLSFLFASDSPNFRKELDDISKTIGYGITKSTNDTVKDFCIKDAKRKSAIKYISFTTIGIIVVTIISLLLCSANQTY